jgi:hypothetical protein
MESRHFGGSDISATRRVVLMRCWSEPWGHVGLEVVVLKEVKRAQRLVVDKGYADWCCAVGKIVKNDCCGGKTILAQSSFRGGQKIRYHGC